VAESERPESEHPVVRVEFCATWLAASLTLLQAVFITRGEEQGMKVRDWMTREVASVRRNDKLLIADDVMRLGRIRHTPVIDDHSDDLVGIVSQRDLFRGALASALGYGQHAQQKVMGTRVIKDVMTTDPVTTTPDASLAEAARTMLERKVGCLPVIEDGRLVGILTESDFLRFAAEHAGSG
jgi:CBS domain-containing protein